MEDNSGMSIFNQDISMGDDPFGFTETEETTDEDQTTQDVVDEKDDENINNASDPEDQEEKVGGDESTEGDETKSEDNADTSSSALYSSLAAVLSEQGIISLSDDSTIKNADGLVAAVKAQIEEAEYSDLTDNQREYLKALRDGVPAKVIEKQQQTAVQWDKMTDEVVEDNEQLRHQLIVQDLLSKGFTQARASKQLKLIVDAGEDLEEAKLSRESLKVMDLTKRTKAIDDAKAEALADNQRKTDDLKKIEDSIHNTDEIIKGVKISSSMRDKVYNNMVTAVGADDRGVAVNALTKYSIDNPTDYNTKLYYLWELTNGFQDFSKLEKQKATNAVKKLEKVLKTNPSTVHDSESSFMSDPESYSNITDFDGHTLA